MDNFLKGFEKYKQETSLYPHPDRGHILSEQSHGQRALKTEQDKTSKETRSDVNVCLEKIRSAYGVSKRSQLAFRQANTVERDA